MVINVWFRVSNIYDKEVLPIAIVHCILGQTGILLQTFWTKVIMFLLSVVSTGFGWYRTVDINWTHFILSLPLRPEEFRKTQGKSHLTDNLAYFLGSGYIATDAVTKKVSIRGVCPLLLLSDKMCHEEASKKQLQNYKVWINSRI